MFDQTTTSSTSSRRLSASGVRTIGRFVWEHFSGEHVEPAKEAFDVIYSMTAAEQERYRGLRHRDACPLGMSSGDDLGGCRRARPDEVVAFIFPGGSGPPQAAREAVLRRFARRGRPPAAAGQGPGRPPEAQPVAQARPRRTRASSSLVEDQPTDEHLRTFADCDVCLTPSRWEGLGLPLYEALAFGMPIITNDDPPMNEVVARRRERDLRHERTRTARRSPASPASGPTSTSWRRPSSDSPIRSCGRELSAGAERERERRSWTRTVRTWVGWSSGQPCRRDRAGSRLGTRGEDDGTPEESSSRPCRGCSRTTAGAVRRRRHPLRHDAAAADARRPPGPGDPSGDALRARADRARRSGAAHRPTLVAVIDLAATSAGATSASTPDELRERFDGDRAVQCSARRARELLRALREQARASRAGATRRPATCATCCGIQRVLPEARFIHLIRDGRDVALRSLR